MKIVQIPQPFATLVCAGIADVAFTKFDLYKNFVLPSKVLVYATEPVHPYVQDDINKLLSMRAFEICTYQKCGILPPDIDAMPTNAFIGMATFTKYGKKSASPWADEGYTNLSFEDPVLFKEPIFTELTFLQGAHSEYPFSEEDIPETTKIERMRREGTTLTIPLNREEFDRIKNTDASAFPFPLTPFNHDLFYDEEEKAYLVDNIIFTYNDEALDFPMDMHNYGWCYYPNCDGTPAQFLIDGKTTTLKVMNVAIMRDNN